MKRLIIFLAMASVVIAACSKKDLLPVAYINEAEGSTFTPAEVSAYGADVTISFSTNYQWQIRGWSKLGFCSLSATKGDAGNVALTVKVEPNYTDDVRVAEFEILAGAAVQKVTITQTETNALDIGTTSYPVPAEGGLVEVAVSANIEYTVTIPSDITWIKEAPQSKAMVNSYVMFDVEPNISWLPRSASGITITGKDLDGEDITYDITISQSENANVTWTKTFTADYPDVARSTPFHVAMFGEELYLADSDGSIHSVDPATGAYKGAVTVPGLSVSPQSMVNDDAGNLLFAPDANMSMLSIYVYDGSSVELLTEYNAATFSGYTLGNLRVVGDVKKDAVVTALAALWGNSPYYVAWQIKDGVVQSPVFGTITPSNPPSSVIYGCVSPVSADLSDGLVFIGYAGAPYALYYCADPTGAKSWNTVYDTGTAGNENYNSISIAEFDGRKYCAIGEDNHFGYTNPTVYLVDITDMSDVELVYKGSIPGVFASVAAMDLKLVPEGDVLKIYIVDAGYDTAGCIELPRQESI